jgi:hypothetical protein
MSADNGIYILQTLRRRGAVPGGEYEYRVAHLQGVENYLWDSKRYGKGGYSKNPDVWIKNARKMWRGCTVYVDRDEAFAEATRIYDEIMKDDFPIVEYGICEIVIDRLFTPRKKRKQRGK